VKSKVNRTSDLNRKTRNKRKKERKRERERERRLKRSNFSNKSFCVISFTWMCVWHNLTKKEGEKIWLMSVRKEKRRERESVCVSEGKVCVCVCVRERESLNLRWSVVCVCEQNICLLIRITFIIFRQTLFYLLINICSSQKQIIIKNLFAFI